MLTRALSMREQFKQSAFALKIGYPRFLNLGAEGTRGFQQVPLAASAAPIQESVLPIEGFWVAVCQI